MLKQTIAIVLGGSLLFSSMLYAQSHSHSHGDGMMHSHGQSISKKDAEKNGVKLLKGLADQGQIDASWKKIETSKETKQIEVDDQQTWRVAFENKEIKDAAKQSLYVFMTLLGDMLGASYEAMPQPRGHSHDDHGHSHGGTKHQH